jgi:hypothetical protein
MGNFEENIKKMLYTINGVETDYEGWVDKFVSSLFWDINQKESGNTREIFEHEKSENSINNTTGIDYGDYEEWLENYAYDILDDFIEYENNVNGVILKVEIRKDQE